VIDGRGSSKIPCARKYNGYRHSPVGRDFDSKRLLALAHFNLRRKELRWRKATLSEARKAVNAFHPQMAKETDGVIEG
jgi:hypothetical protein